MGPGALSQILSALPKMYDENLLVGYDTSDDACVYKLTDEIAVIQTADFFPPMVDDPYTFGQVAAANALSDVYAMGGTPRLAMNLLCVPNCLPPAAVAQILKGGADKAMEAGCVIAGGHSIEDLEPKYGLCVTGVAHPDKIWRNTGAQAGDVLVLTKPLGSGILNTAHSAGMLDEESTALLFEQMTALNKKAADALAGLRVHACTDITGFGLLGHAAEMAGETEVSLLLQADALPLLPNAQSFAEMGIIPAGAYRNRDYVGEKAIVDESVPRALFDIICDPQTSGGLLVALPREDAGVFLKRMSDNKWARIVGSVTERGRSALRII